MTQLTHHTLTRGFLPETDPPHSLPPDCAAWQQLADELPKLVLTTRLRSTVAGMPSFPLEALTTEPEQWRAATALAYIASLTVLGTHDRPVASIPAVLARPLVDVAHRLGIPPILSYGLQALHNWRRHDPNAPIATGNLTLLHNFLGGMDEEWFVTLHIEIEASAATAVQSILPAQAAAQADDPEVVAGYLIAIGDTLDVMHATLGRMTERCDPYIYYHRVRPFMFGWKDNPALPDGVVYEGVAAFGGRPVQFRGETGAQSSIIPAIDAALGIRHEKDSMRIYLTEMRDYMPPRHRAFLEQIERGPSIRTYVVERGSSQPALRDAYNYAVEQLARFRARHIEYAALYILKPASGHAAVGTGGTPFTFYLKKHIKETEAHLLAA